MTRYYCTIDDLLSIAELGFKRESVALDAIAQASQFLEGKKQLNGNFIPITATKTFDGTGNIDLRLRQYLLSITSITHDGTTLETTDYLKYPLNAYWENGPYTRLRVDPAASNLSVWTCEEEIVSIVGSWGKYSESALIGETVSLAAADTTALVVSNGANVSPGMILLIESEQVAVKATGATSDSTTDTNGAIAATDASITVDDGSQFNELEIIKIDNEKMRIVDIASNELYVDRAYNGTRAQAHNDGVSVLVYRTYTIERGVNGTTAAIHASKAVSRYNPPHDVFWLCKQIAGLMLKKESSHFSGKVGSADLGEVYYFNEFPKSQIAETRQNYRINIL